MYKCHSRLGPSAPFYIDVFSLFLDRPRSTLCEIYQHTTNFKEQIVKNTHSVLASTPFLKGVCKKNTGVSIKIAPHC